jgi:histone acetyltransferase 1
MRISQFMILPPYQKQGHGNMLYAQMYSMFVKDEKVIDITVEDPNDAFQDMRDKHDLSVLLKKQCLMGVGPEDITRQNVLEIQREFKLCQVPKLTSDKQPE